MEENQRQMTRVSGRDPRRQLSGKTALYASVVGVIVSGPLVGLMGLSLFGTIALSVVAFPLLLLSGPLLVGSGLVLAAAVAAFSAAGTMAVAGMAVFGWAFRQVRSNRCYQSSRQVCW